MPFYSNDTSLTFKKFLGWKLLLQSIRMASVMAHLAPEIEMLSLIVIK